MAEWLRTLIFSTLDHSLSHCCGFMPMFSPHLTIESVTRKTGKHLMTGKRRKTLENTKILQENTEKSSFIVLWYTYDVCTDYNVIYIYILSLR